MRVSSVKPSSRNFPSFSSTACFIEDGRVDGSQAVLLGRAGPEIGVAATKTFLTQIVALYLLALGLAKVRNTRPAEELLKIGRGLHRAPEKVQEAIGLLEDWVGRAVEMFAGARCALFLGRGHLYPAALEGTLKLKEISYLPAEGYPLAR